MRLLSKAAYEMAVEFLESRARPLDRALYHYHFGGSSSDPSEELAKFQNPDGGFGHALEPDLRLPGSSVIATTVALQILRELNTPGNHPLVESACRFLNATYDSANVNWLNVPANIDDAPHAPWWRYDPDPHQSPSNPRAEVAGYLLDYATHFPGMMRSEVVDAVLETLHQHGEAEMEMHDLFCYLRFYESRNLSASQRSKIKPILASIINKSVERDPGAWQRYGLPPLKVISGPPSPFAVGFESLIAQNLDMVIETQTRDGAWYPDWSWENDWPEAWEQANVEWAGHLTLRNLMTLRAFERLAA